MIFTGVIASSRDRDGIPNVIPEAMAAGCLVLGSVKLELLKPSLMVFQVLV